MKAIVAIPCFTNIYNNYHTALISSGFDVIISDDFTALTNCDGLLLPGGGDIDPCFFGQDRNGARNIDYSLDQLQIKIALSFIHHKKPILGICKGLQILNVCFGGDLLQDIPTAFLHAYEGKDKIHETYAKDGTFLSAMYGTEFVVNSAHHQAIGKLGDGLSVIQTAPDGIIEAMEHRTLPIFGVQWHPERMGFQSSNKETVNGEKIFSYYFSLF